MRLRVIFMFIFMTKHNPIVYLRIIKNASRLNDKKVSVDEITILVIFLLSLSYSPAFCVCG